MSATQNALNNTYDIAKLVGTLAATNFPALTGDVTNTAGALATTIAALAVTTAKINTAAVTYAKIQTMSTVTLLGNPTGGALAPSEVTLGTGLSFSGQVLNATPTFQPMTTTTVAGTTQSMTTNNAYTANNASAVTFTLPTSLTVGDELLICGLGAGGWILAQNASQQINFGNLATTSGVGGSISSQNRYDSIKLKYVAANIFVVTASQGNMTVV